MIEDTQLDLPPDLPAGWEQLPAGTGRQVYPNPDYMKWGRGKPWCVREGPRVIGCAELTLADPPAAFAARRNSLGCGEVWVETTGEVRIRRGN